ncbi:unnamed protein product [Ranitomeya imitator]|uniref:Neurotrophin-3 n=1 Tax=Ranitomeya imitator TaxID=111125 RepID=A0ABN9KYQ1_9NEOB|nr:unnamed protein product [Ranitomeya imitator]
MTYLIKTIPSHMMVFDDVFANGDDIDSEGSEGTHPVKKPHSFVSLDIHKENSKLNHVTSDQRQTNSLGGFGDEPNLRRRKDFPQIDYPLGKALFSLHMKRTDSTSSLTEKEHIRSLDLSANDLESIDLINKNVPIDHSLGTS